MRVGSETVTLFCRVRFMPEGGHRRNDCNCQPGGPYKWEPNISAPTVDLLIIIPIRSVRHRGYSQKMLQVSSGRPSLISPIHNRLPLCLDFSLFLIPSSSNAFCRTSFASSRTVPSLSSGALPNLQIALDPNSPVRTSNNSYATSRTCERRAALLGWSAQNGQQILISRE